MIKKIIVIIIFYFPIFVYSQISDKTLFQIVDYPLIEAENNFFSFQNNYLTSDKVGIPSLPYHIKSYVIPADSEIDSLIVTQVSCEKYNNQYLLYPLQKEEPISQRINKQQKKLELDSIFYESSKRYPLKTIDVVFNGYIMGYHIISVAIYPIVYMPKKRELFLRNYEYTINFKSINRNSPQQIVTRTEYRNSLARDYILTLVENAEDIDRFQPKINTKKNSSNLNLTYQKATNKRLSSSNNNELTYIPDYIIVTSNALKSSLQKLADWKTKKGVYTQIVTIEKIKKEYQGSDTQEKLRNFLLEVKAKWGSGLFVMLAGDKSHIPCRMLMGGQHILRPSDLYYSDMQNFNYINDNLLYANGVIPQPSFFLSRIPIQNQKEAAVYVDKVLTYEKMTNVPERNYVMKGATAFDYCCRNDYKRSIISYYENIPLESLFMFDNADSSSIELNRQNFLSVLNGNRGFDKIPVHFVYHIDHSSPLLMGTSSLLKGESIGLNDVDNLKNNPYYYVLFSQGCEPADFSVSCIASHFLTAPEGGAISYMGYSDSGFFHEKGMLSELLCNMYQLNTPKNIGVLFNKIHMYGMFNYFRKTKLSLFARFHLLGDPEMPVWTAEPKMLDVSISPEEITNGENTITVKVNNLPSMDSVRVCLKKGNEGYAVKTIHDNLLHNFTFKPMTSGQLYVTVTGQNFIPYEDSIKVNTQQLPYAVIDSIYIDDDKQGASYGNGNHKIESGETIELSLWIKNEGGSPLTRLSGSVICNSSEISLKEECNSITWNAINSGLRERSQQKITFTVGCDCPTRENEDAFRFYLQMKDHNSNKSYNDEFFLNVYSPELTVGNQEILFTDSGDDIVEPNEYVVYNVALRNLGKGSATGLSCKVISQNENIIVSNTSSFLIKDVESGENTLIKELELYAKDTYSTNTNLLCHLEIQNEYGKKWDFTIDPISRPGVIDRNSLKLSADDSSIKISWGKVNDIVKYNVYGCKTKKGVFSKKNNYSLSKPYFVDDYLKPSTSCYYILSSINKYGNETILSDTIKFSTTLKRYSTFPVVADGQFAGKGSVTIANSDSDPELEIFGSEVVYSGSLIQGRILAYNLDGTEVYDIDSNKTSVKGFQETNMQTNSSPTVTDVNNDGSNEVIFAMNKADNTAAKVCCFKTQLSAGARKPEKKWDVDMPAGNYFCSSLPVVNLDKSEDGSKETIVQLVNGSTDGTLAYVIDMNGNIIHSLKADIAATYSTGAPAIADLDDDGDLDIAIGTSSGLIIWENENDNFSYQRIRPKGYYFCSTPTICDLDNDGIKEIIIVGKDPKSIKEHCFLSYVYVFNFKDGMINELEKWGESGKQTYDTKELIAANLGGELNVSVGDIDGNCKLEIVVVDKNKVKVWDYRGKCLLTKAINSRTTIGEAPLIADVDTDAYCEIIYSVECNGSESEICAIKIDGSNVKGFPMKLNSACVSRSMAIADLDLDGFNELVANTEATETYVWQTEGSSNLIEWGADMYDSSKNSFYDRPSTLIIHNDGVWNKPNYHGNVIIDNVELTVNSSCMMHIDKPFKVIIQNGGTLHLTKGGVVNANVEAYSSGHVIVDDNGSFLNRGKSFSITKGATLILEEGSVMEPKY